MLVLLVIGVPPSGGQITSNVLRRTLLIQASETGTAFTIEVDNRQYIITAKHVVDTLPNEIESTIKVMKRGGWSELKVRIFKCDDPVDIAVLVPPSQLTINYQLEPTSQGLAVGQDAYFVGYPYGSLLTYKSLPDVFGLIKKAIVSGFGSMPEVRAQTILLDGYNNPGFSGSPVVFRDLSQSGIVYKVAGVLVSFVFDASPVVKKKEEIRANQVTAADQRRGNVVKTITDGRVYRVEDTDQLVKLNTGIATAWDIGSAVDLIRRHPIGPRAVDNFAGDEASTQTGALPQ